MSLDWNYVRRHKGNIGYCIHIPDLMSTEGLDKDEKERLILLLENRNYIRSCSFDNNGYVKSLDMNIEGPIHQLICFPNLEILKLSYKSNKYEDKFIMIHSNSLRRLKLYGQKFYRIPNLDKLNSLELLDIRNNLKYINWFGDLPNLYKIDFSHNLIDSLENLNNLAGCKNIRKLDFSHNQIMDLCGFKPLLSFSNLIKIDLSYNKITNFNITYNLLSIRELNISNNEITDLNIANHFPNLKRLNVSYNQIERISALKDLPNLKYLNLNNNKLSQLENFSNLPNLETIEVLENKVRFVSDLENLPNIKEISGICLKDCSKDEIEKLFNYLYSIDLFTSMDFEFLHGGDIFEDLFIIKGPFPQAKFKVNDYITLKLIDGKTQIFVNNYPFRQCKYLLLTIPLDKTTFFDKIRSIDEAAEIFENSMKKVYKKNPISPEIEFWAHCSNLQAWVENKYNTQLLHSNLAFPLLNELFHCNDPTAKNVFKEEIAKRYTHGSYNTRRFLEEEGYLRYLSSEELESL